MSNKESSLVGQREKLVKDLEDAIKRREYIKKVLLDPVELDKFLNSRVAAIKEKIALLDVNDRLFMIQYVDYQARINETNMLRAELHMPENNCKEIQTRINEIQALIDERESISKRERI